MKTILVLTHNPFPYGSADSKRMRVFVDAFLKNGYDIVVLTRSRIGNELESIKTIQVRNEKILFSEKFENYLSNKTLWRAVLDLDLSHVKFVLFNTRVYPPYRRVISHFKKHGIPIVVEMNEHYSCFFSKGGVLNPNYWLLRYSFHKLISSANLVIAITREIEKIAQELRKATITIPSVEEINYCPDRVQKRNLFKILYVGILIDRENPLGIVSFYKKLKEIDDRYEIHFVGRYNYLPESKKNLLKVKEELRNYSGVHFHGELSDELLSNHIHESGVACLLRRNSYAEECSFPTRLVEYLNSGLFVVTSKIGDIPFYLNGVEGVSFFDCTSNIIDIHQLIQVWDDEKCLLRSRKIKKIFDSEQVLEIPRKLFV